MKGSSEPRVPRDPVRALQHALYRAAKADPGRRFHALFDKVCRRDVLQRAWAAVRRNDGAPGIDKTTLAQVEEYGVDRLLDEVAAELRERRYRPLPARRVLIPKPGLKDQYRPLSIPAVRDRIVQAAVKIVLEPVFEADMADCSFGLRPRRSAHDALQVLIGECARGRRWVVETDIADCFSAIPHQELMHAIEERVCDQSVLTLLRAILRAGAMEDGQVRRPVNGTPQGGPVSPLLCNVYLHRLDRAWDGADGAMVRFADDVVVMCWSRSQAERALARLTELLAELGLEPKAAKTRIIHLQVGGDGFDFLGFHHRLVRSRGDRGKPKVTFLARWPADKAMQHARDRIREITSRRWMLLWPEAIVERLNAFLRGWAAYFRYGHSAQRLSKIRRYAQWRLAHFMRRRHRRSMAFGWQVLLNSRPIDLGLISLYGITVAPRAGKPWRVRPNAAGERRR
ncbi:group II intron reverse transcriptase/maturase [Nonomuraea longispora]|uniref:group II intron reverse transcriptase/maturase n=1 Tax=Nonomuraea longispora TaxID=1848320 RepID=UPI001C7032F6|nr:group II intron reverse transcriptase/maturase [Nonomuraea longispora]